MGAIFSSQEDILKAQQAALERQKNRELRFALRHSDGPSAGTSSSSNNAATDDKQQPATEKKNDATDNKDDQQEQQQQQHRSAHVLKLLRDMKAVQPEHLLELVDNEWEEPHPGVRRVIEEMLSKSTVDEHVMLATQCVLYQRCWLAAELALQSVLDDVRDKNKKKKKKNNDGDSSATTRTYYSFPRTTSSSSTAAADMHKERVTPEQLQFIFASAAEPAPMGILLQLLELGWVRVKEHAHFSVLIRRLKKELNPPRSPEETQKREQEMRATLQQNAPGSSLGMMTTAATSAANTSASRDIISDAVTEKLIKLHQQRKLEMACQVVVSLLAKLERPISSLEIRDKIVCDDDPKKETCDSTTNNNNDESSTDKKKQKTTPPAVVLFTGEAAEAMRPWLLGAYAAPWSQLEATVSDVPRSWTVSRPEMRRYVVHVALCVKKRGMTFPVGARVLSYLVCPNSEL